MLAEIMREKILLKFDQEIPHGIAVVINSFRKNEAGVYEVNLDIICEKPAHKAILIFVCAAGYGEILTGQSVPHNVRESEGRLARPPRADERIRL